MFLQKTLNILDFDDDSEEFNRISILFDEAQQKMYDSFERVSVSFSEEDMLKKHCQSMERVFGQCENGIQQFLLFLEYFNPITREELNKSIEHKGSLIGRHLFNNIVFDKNKRIVFESTKADAIMKEEYEFADSIRLHNSVTCALYIGTWSSCKIIDDALKLLIKEIVYHNLLIPQSKCCVVYDSILEGLENDKLRIAVYDLIPQFEEGCRHFLYKHKKISPQVRKGQKILTANLNDILVEKGDKQNKFRKKIAELIGEDLTLTIEYLSCRKLSGNLRNENYHSGYDDANKFSIDEAGLFYFLIKAYCMGYDESINCEIED